MIALLKAWIASKLRLLEWACASLIVLGSMYFGYHIRVVLDEAAASKQTQKLVEAAPKVITKTQVLTRIIHDSKDPCSSSAIPAAIINGVR